MIKKFVFPGARAFLFNACKASCGVAVIMTALSLYGIHKIHENWAVNVVLFYLIWVVTTFVMMNLVIAFQLRGRRDRFIFVSYFFLEIPRELKGEVIEKLQSLGYAKISDNLFGLQKMHTEGIGVNIQLVRQIQVEILDSGSNITIKFSDPLNPQQFDGAQIYFNAARDLVNKIPTLKI